MPVMERIQAEVDGHPIVLFMKGTPQFPMCGFSSRTVAALHEAGAKDYRTINVLEAPEIRANQVQGTPMTTKPNSLEALLDLDSQARNAAEQAADRLAA